MTESAEATTSAAPSPAAPLAAAPFPVQLLRVSRMSSTAHAEGAHFLYLPVGYTDEPDKLWPVLLFLHGDGSRRDAKMELAYIMRNGPLCEAWIQKRTFRSSSSRRNCPRTGVKRR